MGGAIFSGLKRYEVEGPVPPTLPPSPRSAALSQCCIRALGARTRPAGPSSPRCTEPLPRLELARVFVARPYAEDSAALLWCGPHPRVPREGAGPSCSRLVCHAAGAEAESGPRARLTGGETRGPSLRVSRLSFVFPR